MFGTISAMRVGILAVDDMLDLGLACLMDILSTANTLSPQVGLAGEPFQTIPLGLGDRIHTANGLQLMTTPWAALDELPELLVMPALGLRPPADIVDTVRDNPALEVVSELPELQVAVAAACSGTFFLAEAGLLDGRTATTSWWLGPAFRARYPAVDLDESRTLIVAEDVTTAGAAFAHIDLALSLVRRRSPALADLVARYLVIGDRPAQGSVAVMSMLATANPVLAEFERHVREHLAEPIGIAAAAGAVGVSERTLQRITAETLGISPLRFVQDVRLDHALVLSRTTDGSAEQIAHAVGYRNAGTLGALLRRERHTTLSELRRDRPAVTTSRAAAGS